MVAAMRDGVHDKFDTTINEIDEVEVRLSERMMGSTGDSTNSRRTLTGDSTLWTSV